MKKLSHNSIVRDMWPNLLLNSKESFWRTNSTNLAISFVGIFEKDGSSNLFFNGRIPSLSGMLGYRLTTSAMTREEP